MTKIAGIHEGSRISEVGDVRTSMLSEAAFQTKYGTQWILSDGRSIVGSEWETITGDTNVPDMRGQYLRGKNNGRADGQENPDGELGLGSQTGHKTSTGGLTVPSTGAHQHISSVQINVPAHRYGNSGVNNTPIHPAEPGNTAEGLERLPLTNSAGAHSHSLAGGSNETAAKNITINYFVKIN